MILDAAGWRTTGLTRFLTRALISGGDFPGLRRAPPFRVLDSLKPAAIRPRHVELRNCRQLRARRV
eukprot:12125525-Alexandrium_andersonii.AAC.1